MEAGRNDPCPCGSGKKFKVCHGGPNRAQASGPEAAWSRLRRVLEGYPAMMLRFAAQVYGRDAIHEAWDEFTLWESDSDEPRFDPATPHLEVFLPWFFHHWAPDPEDTSIANASVHGRSPTSVLLERRGRRLDPVLRRYFEGCIDAPFSFHEVLRCDPGRGLRTRDFFTGVEHDVLERSASRTLRAGDTFFAQLVSAEGITLLEACGPHAIPPRDKLGLIDFRERVTRGHPLPTERLKDWDIEVRAEYLAYVDQVLNPPAPRLQTTDGEAVVCHRLFFEIDSPRRALNVLKDLTLDETEDDLLGAAELDADGEVRHLTFAWKVAGNAMHRSWENTVHGNIDIDGRELRAEVHSAERAARLRDILEERLGESIRHTRTEIESVDDAMARSRSSGASGTAEGPSRVDDPADIPEVVLDRIREMTAAHYEGWPSEEIPALGGLTPLEAVKDRVGREKVEAIITSMEQNGAQLDPPVDESVFERLRERLGLVQISDATTNRPA